MNFLIFLPNSKVNPISESITHCKFSIPEIVRINFYNVEYSSQQVF